MSGSVSSLPDFRDGTEAEPKREGSLEQMQETPIDEGDTAGAYFSIFMYYVQVHSQLFKGNQNIGFLEGIGSFDLLCISSSLLLLASLINHCNSFLFG